MAIMAVTGASTDNRRAAHLLSAADRTHFLDDGYLVLRQFATAEEVAVVNRAVDRVWNDKSIYNPVTVSAYTGTPEYTETYIRNVDDRARAMGNKLNHLYLYDHAVLDVLTSEKVIDVVGDLIEGTPLLFNGLNLETRVRAAPPLRHLLHAAALREPDGGPVVRARGRRARLGRAAVLPHSHTIPPYRFSQGEIWALNDEMPAFDEYIAVQLGDRGLKPEKFRGASGDVFIWHAQLYHGGSAIEVPGSTRRSMVAHYWRVEDMPPGMCLKIGPDRFILDPRNMPVATNFDPSFTPAAATL